MIDEIWLKRQSCGKEDLSQISKIGSLEFKSNTNRTVVVKDPITKKTICKIRNPRLAINGYGKSRLPKECIDLGDYMEKGVKAPDFGFDSHLINPIQETLDITRAVAEVTMNKDKHMLLWGCVKKMAETRENFNQILRSKFFRLPKNLRRLPEIIQLFEETQAEDNNFKTDFTKDIDEDEIQKNIQSALTS